MTSLCNNNDISFRLFVSEFSDHRLGKGSVKEMDKLLDYFPLNFTLQDRKNSSLLVHMLVNPTWALSIFSALLVGLSGVLPIFYGNLIYSKHISSVLSFAVGCLLGDVFFHLLPEVWLGSASSSSSGWILLGVVVFFVIEKIMKHTEQGQEKPKDGSGRDRNVSKITGYLNLLANCIDNFAHGLTIAASYLVSPWVGIITTIAILCHEIPHEVGDFAVLISSGFNLWSAAKAQFLTSFGGLIGVLVGLINHHCTNSVTWILAFTAGGFLYLALGSILPTISKIHAPRESVATLLFLIAGVGSMGAVTVFEHKACEGLTIV